MPELIHKGARCGGARTVQKRLKISFVHKTQEKNKKGKKTPLEHVFSFVKSKSQTVPNKIFR